MRSTAPWFRDRLALDDPDSADRRGRVVRRLGGIFGAATLVAAWFAGFAAVTPSAAHAAQTGSANYDTPQVYSWTVPAGVDIVEVDTSGAPGGTYFNAPGSIGHNGGLGGLASGWVRVTPGTSYTVVVGSPGGSTTASTTVTKGGTAGIGAGGAGGGCGALQDGLCLSGAAGGGLSGFFQDDPQNPGNPVALIVAGGGGGGAWGGAGGSAGTPSGRPGSDDVPATGGSQTAGGAPGQGGQELSSFGATAGTAFIAGKGGHQAASGEGGGGAGAGYFGGGGGAVAGGAGGSDYIAPAVVRGNAGTGAGTSYVHIAYGSTDPLMLAQEPLPHATVGKQYRDALQVIGFGVPSVTIGGGTTVPPGMTLTGDGVISGTPLLAGTYPMTLLATSPLGGGVFFYTLVVDPAREAPAFSSATPPSGVVGQSYSYKFPTTGYPAPTVTRSAGTLPPGLTLASDGTLSGTPTANGKYTFTLAAQNSASSDAATQQFTLTVNARPVANAGKNQTVPPRGTVTLDGTQSTDPQSLALTYQWSEVSGPTVAVADDKAAKTTFAAPTGAATVTMRLTVTDTAGLTGTSDTVITVKAPK